jgi:NADPH:quinone reductase-like Zn-dependent oxidoreductase
MAPAAFRLRQPRVAIRGTDFAGVVEAVGAGVTRWQPGDAVFGEGTGTFAEHAAVPADKLAAVPDGVTFDEAAALPLAATTALLCLSASDPLPGSSALINGASGGVGTFAVQIAKAYGAEVTAVCSTRNVGLVRSLGADRVVDYTREDFTQDGERYDVILDNVANRPILEVRRVLKPKGTYLVIGGGGPDANPWFGAFAAPTKAWFISHFVDEDLKFFLSHASLEDTVALGKLMEEGKVTPVVDRTYPLDGIQDAMRYLEAGHARGKVVLTID